MGLPKQVLSILNSLVFFLYPKHKGGQNKMSNYQLLEGVELGGVAEALHQNAAIVDANDMFRIVQTIDGFTQELSPKKWWYVFQVSRGTTLFSVHISFAAPSHTVEIYHRGTKEGPSAKEVRELVTDIIKAIREYTR